MLVVGSDESSGFLADLLAVHGSECVAAAAPDTALGLFDLIARKGRLVDVVFVSVALREAEALIANIRTKDIFNYCRITVFGVKPNSEVQRLAKLGANSCISGEPEILRIAAQYWSITQGAVIDAPWLVKSCPVGLSRDTASYFRLLEIERLAAQSSTFESIVDAQ